MFARYLIISNPLYVHIELRWTLEKENNVIKSSLPVRGLLEQHLMQNNSSFCQLVH